MKEYEIEIEIFEGRGGECVRCPDPSPSGIVVKIILTALPE